MNLLRGFQCWIERELKAHSRFWEGAVAIAVLLVVAFCAITEKGPFDVNVPHSSTTQGLSVWEYLLADRVTLGAIHLLIISFVFYGSASMAALFVSGRWLRGIGKSTIVDDDTRVKDAALLTGEEAVKNQDSLVKALEKTIEETSKTLEQIQNGEHNLTGKKSMAYNVDKSKGDRKDA